MKKEKREQMKNRSRDKQIGEKVRIINIISFIVACIGFALLMLDKNPMLTRIGNALIIAGAVSIVLTIAFQAITASKMRKGYKK